MTWTVVLRSGSYDHLTNATIQFDRWGQTTRQHMISCATWEQGFDQAQQQGYSHALFVDSGTGFEDWFEWKNLIDHYPHQGLIAHLIWHPGQQLELHPQCWFVDLERFSLSDLTATVVTHPVPVRSTTNLHDDYTPLWVRSGTQTMTYTTTGFGQGLVARQLADGLGIVNWNNTARGLKWFAYNETQEQLKIRTREYCDLAEHQLWVLNNEPVKLAQGTRLLTPGSGMCWILNAIHPHKQLHILDISQTQIDFCQQLWQQWDGNNYGDFAWQFIQQRQLQHYEIDLADIDPIQRLKLHNHEQFVTHVNSKFHSVLKDLEIDDFARSWQHAQATKSMTFDRGNLVDWILKNGTLDYDAIWCSNILEYKWTWLNNNYSEIDQFKQAIQLLEQL